MDRFFHVTEKGSTIRTEIMAGITTFMAMAYILMVNAGMFSNPFGDGTDVLGVSYGAIYVATAISAVVGTLLIGLLSNLPLAQASGMGLNAYFVYTVCVGLGLSYANALVLVLFDGIIFVLLTVTGLRKIIFDSIPHEVKVAISAGIGLFIAFIGLQNAGIVVNDASTCVNLHSFNVFTGEQTWATIFPMLITLIAVFAIGAMSKKKVRGAVLWGILGAAVLYYAIGLITVPGFYASAVAPNLTSDFFGAFRDFGTQAFAAVFKSGFDFSAFIAANGTGAFVVMLLTTMLAYGHCRYDQCVGGAEHHDTRQDRHDPAPFHFANMPLIIAVCGIRHHALHILTSNKLSHRAEVLQGPDAEHDLAHDLVPGHTAHGGVAGVHGNLPVVSHEKVPVIRHLIRQVNVGFAVCFVRQIRLIQGFSVYGNVPEPVNINPLPGACDIALDQQLIAVVERGNIS